MAPLLHEASICLLLAMPGVYSWAGTQVHVWRHGEVGIQIDGLRQLRGLGLGLGLGLWQVQELSLRLWRL